MTPQKSLGWDLRAISKSFGDKYIIENINLKIAPGEFVAIFGKSGIGKSTLLRIMSGLIPASSGQIFWNGELLEGPPAGLGFVTQNYASSLLPWFTVKRNVALPLLERVKNKIIIEEKVMSILSLVGLEGSEEKYPSQLSGGMQQRVALARALVIEPSLLVLDEPFASVDALVRLELEDLLAALVKQRSVTTLLVTHDVEEAVYLSDRVIVLSGSPAAISGDVFVELGRERNQVATRSSKNFLQCRNEIFDILLKG